METRTSQGFPFPSKEASMRKQILQKARAHNQCEEGPRRNYVTFKLKMDQAAFAEQAQEGASAVQNLGFGSHCVVTIACEGRFLRADRNLLAMASPYLKGLLEEAESIPNKKHAKPVILLRNVSYPMAENMLKLISKGEVRVGKNDIHNFIEVACQLQVAGMDQED